MEPLRIGVVGCGAISGIYLKNLIGYHSTEVVAVADLDADRAARVAAEHGVPKALSPEDLVADSDVELVLNLTVPKAHCSVGSAAIKAGKHLYNEKPLCVSYDDAQELLAEADRRGVLVGCAPDTFMGAGLQSCRKMIDDGVIGQPIAAHAFMLSRGHETWHPSPEFYYEQGGGPMLDMGPYYVTALLHLLGPVKRVCGSVKASFARRTITSQPKAGNVVEVETPTHITGEMDFVSGITAHITTTFDVYGTAVPPITIFGTEGTMLVPDPNTFGGEIRVKRAGTDFEKVELTHGHPENSRGIGVLDMAYAIRQGKRYHRASGDLALHALEVMTAFERSSNEGRHILMETSPERPGAMSATEYEHELHRDNLTGDRD
jgi:predicted dehydrogenase